MIACAEAGTGVGSGTCSDSDIGRALGAADASTGAGSRSLVVSWGGSDCGVAVFSFSVGKSLSVSNLTSATIGSGALAAGVWGGAGVSPTVSACGHTAAHRARQTVNAAAMMISSPPFGKRTISQKAGNSYWKERIFLRRMTVPGDAACGRSCHSCQLLIT